MKSVNHNILVNGILCTSSLFPDGLEVVVNLVAVMNCYAGISHEVLDSYPLCSSEQTEDLVDIECSRK